MKIQLLIISLLFMTNGLCARGLDKAFQLLPQPQSVELLPGKPILNLYRPHQTHLSLYWER